MAAEMSRALGDSSTEKAGAKASKTVDDLLQPEVPPFPLQAGEIGSRDLLLPFCVQNAELEADVP